MILEDKREEIRSLIEELVKFDATEDRERFICAEVDKLSPDPEWSQYIFWSDDYIDEDDQFLMDDFLDKIFSYKLIILS